MHGGKSTGRPITNGRHTKVAVAAREQAKLMCWLLGGSRYLHFHATPERVARILSDMTGTPEAELLAELTAVPDE